MSARATIDASESGAAVDAVGVTGPSSRRRGASRWGGLGALMVGAALTLACAGCSDGYPSEDLAQLSPFDMSNAQRLRALNEISRQAHRSERSQFELGPGCQLTVVHPSKAHLRGERRDRPSRAYLLRRAMDAGVVFNEDDRTFEVHLLASADPGAARLGVLMKSASWTHARQADLLVQLVIRDCDRGAPRSGSAHVAEPVTAEGAAR